MKKFVQYIKDAFDELINKVSWPTSKELQSSAVIVLITSFIIAIIVFLMDFSFEHLMRIFYNMFY